MSKSKRVITGSTEHQFRGAVSEVRIGMQFDASGNPTVEFPLEFDPTTKLMLLEGGSKAVKLSMQIDAMGQNLPGTIYMNQTMATAFNVTSRASLNNLLTYVSGTITLIPKGAVYEAYERKDGITTKEHIAETNHYSFSDLILDWRAQKEEEENMKAKAVLRAQRELDLEQANSKTFGFGAKPIATPIVEEVPTKSVEQLAEESAKV